MRIWLTWTFLLASAAALTPPTVTGQAPVEPDVLFSRHRHFRIPFQAGPGADRLRQLQLYVSTDRGRTWTPSATAPPDEQFFRFICDRDGLYWFAVQTLDRNDRYYPPSMETAAPSLKVLVDTLPPDVQVRPLPGRRNEVGVTWSVREENMDWKDPQAVRLEYRPAGGLSWTPLTPGPGPTVTSYSWNPGTNGPLEVRLLVKDRAGNMAEDKTEVRPGAAFGPADPPAGRQPGPGEDLAADPAPNQYLPGGATAQSSTTHGRLPYGYSVTDANRRLINSKRISLNYQLKDVGPSGVSAIELWFTQDGRTWNKYPLPEGDRDQGGRGPLVFEVNGEGIYGFTLVAKSGVGLSVSPPQVGDRPQVWVEVDLTKPQVQLQDVLVGRGEEKGKVMVSWAAHDKNFGEAPVTIAYAEDKLGPWTTIAEKVANTGRYIWGLPPDVPYQFWLKVEATDDARNTGADVTPDMVKVDLSQPRVNILDVAPAIGGD